jgi:hypothetical protein
VLAQIINVYPRLHADLHTSGAELIFAALAAGGTLVLAVATWKLAGQTAEVASQTRQLARETTELAKQTSQDVAAQFRPVLVSDLQLNDDPVKYDEIQGALSLRIHNSGHGPALDVQALVPQNNVAAEPWQRGALATDGRAWVGFQNVWPVDQKIRAELQYRSLSNETYTSAVIIKLEGIPGDLEPVVEDVIVETAPQPESNERSYLLE